VLIVEGEKDVETAYRLGFPDDWAATCNPMGAKKWRASYSDTLHGKRVVILPDADAPGHEHGALIAHALHGIAASVQQLTLPDGCKDLSVWGADRTAPEFHALLNDAMPWGNPVPTVRTHDSWPVLEQDALYGLAGDVVRLYEPHTEADPVALLASCLAEVGAMVGRAPHLILDGGYHPLLFWPVLVGKSSKSRKGTADKRIDALCQLVDDHWTRGECKGTLSSGEGLAFAVRDAQYKEEPVKQGGKPTGDMQTVLVDSGVEDKRLFLVQSEFGAVLRVMEREGNSLSGVLRDAWDGKDLMPMTKANRIRASSPHIAIVGHVTRDELLRNLNSTEACNGFGNRFVWLAVQRSKELPFPSSPDAAAVDQLARCIRGQIQSARTMSTFTLSDRARDAWRALYHDLSAERPGLAGDLLGRAEAQVMRLAALYALLDGVSVIDSIHLRPACALWQYAEASTRYIFGDSTGDPYADTILRALQAQGELDDTNISVLFGRNLSAARLSQAKALLINAGLARCSTVDTGGRPRMLWTLTTN
jgi:hypothetical protein